MKKFVVGLAVSFCLLFGKTGYSQFSTDAPILLEILSNAVSQLYQLMEMVNVSRENLELMEEIRSGIDQALSIYQTLKAPTDPGQYKNWRGIGLALANLQALYGQVAQTAEAPVQRDIDRGVAEAIDYHNQAFDYSNELDQIGKEVENHSKTTSPKGAERLTAQGLGVLIQAENLSIKTQATQLKLQAQALAQQNRHDKEYARRVADDSKTLKASMKDAKTSFSLPRF